MAQRNPIGAYRLAAWRRYVDRPAAGFFLQIGWYWRAKRGTEGAAYRSCYSSQRSDHDNALQVAGSANFRQMQFYTARLWTEGQDGKQELLPDEPTHTMTRFNVALHVWQVPAEKRETQSDWSVPPQSTYPDTKAWEE
jgi:hypothetical protein